MAHDQTIALAREALAEGRVADVVRMVEPLLQHDGAATDAGDTRVVLQALLARVQTVEHGRPRETLRRLQAYAALEARGRLAPSARAEVCLSLGWAHAWHDVETHDEGRALLLLREAAALYAQLADTRGRCWALLGLALTYATADEYALLAQALGEAGALAEAARDAGAQRWLAELRLVLARSRGAACSDLAAALELASRYAMEPQVIGRAAAYLAACREDAGAAPEAVIEAATEAEGLLTGAATHASYPLLLAYRSHLSALLRAGRWDAVGEVAEEGLRHVRSLPAGAGYLRLACAEAALRQGQHARAGLLLQQVREQVHPVRHRLLSLHAELAGARLALATRDPAAARTAAERALHLAEETGHRPHALRARLLMARALLALGEAPGARKHVDPAGDAPEWYRLPCLAARRLEVLGLLALSQECTGRAHRLLEQARLGYWLTHDPYRAEQVLAQLPAPPAGMPAARVDELNRRLALSGQPEALLAATLVEAAAAEQPDCWAALYRTGEKPARLARRGTLASADAALPPAQLAARPGIEAFHLGEGDSEDYLLLTERGDGEALSALRRPLEAAVPAFGLAARRARTLAADPAPRPAPLPPSFDGVAAACTSAPMRALLRAAAPLRRARLPVLITGERGTARGALARYLHPAGDRPFVELDCREASHESLAHALLGHAASGTAGALVRARGGTLYLAHVEALPRSLQPHLLRLLEEGVVLPAGADEPVAVRLRLVASTVGGLREAVLEGAFDEALYARLCSARLPLPPLRARLSEIPHRAHRHLNAERAEDAPRVTLTPRALAALLAYDWPGNERQLRNEMERSLERVCSEPVPVVDLTDLSPALREGAATDHAETTAPPEAVLAGHRSLDEVLADVERQVLARALAAHDGQVSAAAELLGLTRQGLYKKMKRLGIDGSSAPGGDGALRRTARP